MRRSAALMLLPLVAAVPLAAQFEGTVTFKMPAAGNSVSDMTYFIKGNKMAARMTAEARPAEWEVRMIIDVPNQKMTMLMAMPPSSGMGKGVKMVMDMNQGAASGKAAQTDVKDLGTSETIAGYKCEDYEISENGKPTTRMCISHELGTFAYPQMGGGMRGRGAPPPAWAAAFGNKPMFPLKVWEIGGKVDMEATSVQKGGVPADAFDIPDGYMDMSGMMGRGRGGV